MNIKIRLKYSEEALNRPILAEVIRKSSAEINILHAEINARKGEILVGIEGAHLLEVADYHYRAQIMEMSHFPEPEC